MKINWRLRFAPTGKKMMVFLVALLVVDIGLLLFLTRKPICIETVLFNQMEWVFNNGEKVTSYNCQTNLKVPLNKIFIEKMGDIQRRLSQIDTTLKVNFLPVHPIKLTIFESASQLLQVSADSVVISESLFFRKDWYLERSYLKAWVQQFQKGHGLGLLRLEVLTQFLIWNLGIQDKSNQQWFPILNQWPQMATSWSGYCQSPIKDEAYTAICLSPSFAKKADALTPFSLSFWMAQKLWLSFQVLSITEQIQFFKNLGSFIQQLSKADEFLLSEMSLSELDGFARTEVEVWKNSLESVGMRDWGWSFSSKIIGELDSYVSTLGRVDLFVSKDSGWSTEELQSFQRLSLEEVNYRVIAENDGGVWSFPWLTPVNSEVFPNFKSQNYILISCKLPTVEELLEIKVHADKVIVVQDCNQKAKPIVYSGLLHRGLQFFSLDNKEVKFILINLEALKFLIGRDESLKKKRLVVFEHSSEKKNYLAAKANWTSALWNQKYRAYEVQATVDVVEWFKLPENVWPDFE